MKNILIIALMLVFSVAGIAKADDWCGEGVDNIGSRGKASITVGDTIHEFEWYKSGLHGVVMCLNENVVKPLSYFSLADPSNPLNRSKLIIVADNKFYLQFVASTTNSIVYQLVVVNGRVSNALAMQQAMQKMGFEQVSVWGNDIDVGPPSGPKKDKK